MLYVWRPTVASFALAASHSPPVPACTSPPWLHDLSLPSPHPLPRTFQEALPDREAIERAILEKRKREMLAMLGGGDAGGAPKHKEEGSINLVPKSW